MRLCMLVAAWHHDTRLEGVSGLQAEVLVARERRSFGFVIWLGKGSTRVGCDNAVLLRSYWPPPIGIWGCDRRSCGCAVRGV